MITPAAKRSLSGNRATAVRWARILRSLGHSVTVTGTWPGEGPSGGERASEGRFGEGPPGGGRASEGRFGEGPSGGERASERRFGEGPPGGGRASEERFGERPSGEGRASEERFGEGPPGRGQASEERSGERRTSGSQAQGPDLLVAIHAWRSAASVTAFRGRYPSRPLVVLMSGTDIYRFQHSHPEETAASMAAADRLVGLHDVVADDLPPGFRSKLRVIHQSALPLPGPRRPSRRTFDVCVVGHLREEKDPFRAARAARLAPPASRLRVLHLGKPHDADHARQARAEMAANPRYAWRGEVPRWRVRRTLARCHAMVMSSIMEGGANVVSEAVVAGVPVIASDIPGNVGLLGPDHPALFPPGDTDALRDLLHRAETEPAFLERVRAHGDARRDRFSPARERAAWAALLRELAGP